MPAAQHSPPPDTSRRWTAREVRALIDASPLKTPRYELVDGELLVTPSPNQIHQKVVAVLLVRLHEYAARQGIGHVLPSPLDIELEPEFLCQPDVCVVPTREWLRSRAEGMPIRELLVAIEVLSPSSSRHDRVRKRPKYQRAVPDYWIVDHDARVVERWQPGDERPALIADALEWHPAGATEPFRLDLSTFFADVFGEPQRD